MFAVHRLCYRRFTKYRTSLQWTFSTSQSTKPVSSTAEKKTIEVSFQDNGIAVVCMQRGENRINNEFLQQFNDCLDTVEKTPTCRGVVTTGVGKFFSNGLDTDWMDKLDEEKNAIFMWNLQSFLLRLLVFPLPTVAAINGHCYAGGAVVAFTHDLRVMNSERGWLCFNEVFVKRRLTPFLIKFLRAKMNPGQTLHQALVFGQRFTGPEAASAAMVDKAVAPSVVLQESQNLLETFIGKQGIPSDSFHNMKMDLYADAVNEMFRSKT